MSRFALVALGALTLSSCGLMPGAPEPIPVNYFRSDPRDFDTVRRVMMLPFEGVDGVRGNLDQVQAAFTAEFTKLARFELVPMPERADEHHDIYESLKRGRLSTDALVELSSRYEIDGVLIGSVTSYRAYPPMVLGMRTQLVSLHSGRTVWAADGIYDANDARIVDDLQHYAESFAATEASMHGWEINLISPGKYAAFVSHRLAATCR